MSHVAMFDRACVKNADETIVRANSMNILSHTSNESSSNWLGIPWF